MRFNSIFLYIVFYFMLTTTAYAESTILAGGCFWCMESDFEKLPGVTSVVSGFTGGSLKNPTYNGNHSGHYEAVLINYNADQITYPQLLDHYWVNIDPFDDKGQFCDKGPSYLSAIFVDSQQQRLVAQASKKEIALMFPDQMVVTPILQRETFYPIRGKESYHQNYAQNNPVRYNFYRWNCGRDQRLKEIWGENK